MSALALPSVGGVIVCYTVIVVCVDENRAIFRINILLEQNFSFKNTKKIKATEAVYVFVTMNYFCDRKSGSMFKLSHKSSVEGTESVVWDSFYCSKLLF